MRTDSGEKAYVKQYILAKIILMIPKSFSTRTHPPGKMTFGNTTHPSSLTTFGKEKSAKQQTPELDQLFPNPNARLPAFRR